MKGLDTLTMLIAKESLLPWPMAERLAEAVVRAGYRREQSAPETATPGENISAKSWPDNLLEHPEN
jgi:hypothetical protein